MSDLVELQGRVAATAERLAITQNERRQRNGSLLQTLARLEEKFAAQQQEIAYYRERVRPLETANDQLRALMGRLLDMMDAGLDHTDDVDDPVRRATAMAAEMLERDLIPVVQAPAAPPPSSWVGPRDTAGFAAETAEGRFEDVDFDALAAEAANDSPAETLPEIVRLAAAAAEDDVAAEIALCVADATASAADDAPQPSAADIRALLQRVEAAAARVASVAEAAGSPATSPADNAGRRLAGAA